jgi:alpha-N-acetylglucosaminidase
VGSTLEALNVNPVIYELLLEQPWEPEATVDLAQWAKAYAKRRAEGEDPAVSAAWQQLSSHVFVDNARRTGSTGSIFQAMPELSTWRGRKQTTTTDYRAPELIIAVDRLLQARPATRQADGYRFDVVNLTRQVLCDAAVDVASRMHAAWTAKDRDRFRAEAKTFLELGSDLDALLGTRREFLLGRWLGDARAWGRSPAESDYFESNARQIITAWHRPGGELTDYASRQWNGLLRTYYLPRWAKWVELADDALQHDHAFPEAAYIDWVNRACAQWIAAHDGGFVTRPQGDPVETAERLFRKYAALWQR